MAGVNKVIIVGNLGRDPEVRTFQNGDKVVNLRVATSESWRDKQSGERKEKTEWHQVAIFNEHLAKVAEQYLKKGSTVYLEGSLQTRKYEKDGVEKYSTEIVLARYRGELTLVGGRGGDGDSYEGGDRAPSERRQPAQSGGSAAAMADEDIPFAAEFR